VRITPNVVDVAPVGERLMICRLTLQPHVDTPVHSHAHEQMTIVERGRGGPVTRSGRRVGRAGP
jgi:quercetin dioxygenase-like cupin family protein